MTLAEALLRGGQVQTEAMAKRVIALGMVQVDGATATHAGQKVIPGFNKVFIPPIKQTLINQIEADNLRAATAQKATAAAEVAADPLVVVEGLRSIETEPHWQAYDGEALTLGGRSVLGVDLLIVHDSTRHQAPKELPGEMMVVPKRDPFYQADPSFQDPLLPFPVSTPAPPTPAPTPEPERIPEPWEDFDEEKTLTSPRRQRQTE